MLTHLTGGSAGREGAAIQFGGSIGNQLGRIFHLDEFDHHVYGYVWYECGVFFFARFRNSYGGGQFFAMEVCKRWSYVLCGAFALRLLRQLLQPKFAAGIGIHPEVFHVTVIPELTAVTGAKMAVIAAGCGAVSILFCIALKLASTLYTKYLKNPYVRVVVAALIVMGITFILQTDDYMAQAIS